MLHYQVGELYEPHWDYFQEQVNQQNGGQRVATMLMYLTDVDDGGETVFPRSIDKPVHLLSSLVMVSRAVRASLFDHR